MSHFGGGTKFGGGAVFGGGPSHYERNRDKMFAIYGDGLFSEQKDNTDSVFYRLMCAASSAFEGAQVDAERIQSEGLAPLSVETVGEWADIFRVLNSDVNDDALRALLGAFSACFANETSASQIETVAEAFIADTGDGRTVEAHVHACTMAQCTACLNSGDGCRYIAVLVPEWMWSEYRSWFRALQEYLDKASPFYCEVTACCSNDNVPMYAEGALSTAEPAFYFNKSLIDRDVVRD